MEKHKWNSWPNLFESVGLSVHTLAGHEIDYNNLTFYSGYKLLFHNQFLYLPRQTEMGYGIRV